MAYFSIHWYLSINDNLHSSLLSFSRTNHVLYNTHIFSMVSLLLRHTVSICYALQSELSTESLQSFLGLATQRSHRTRFRTVMKRSAETRVFITSVALINLVYIYLYIYIYIYIYITTKMCCWEGHNKTKDSQPTYKLNFH